MTLRLAPESVHQNVWGDSATRCYYCGLAADSIDHVIPQSVLEQIAILEDPAVTASMYDRHRVRTVDCCRECNSLIGGRYFPTLEARKAFLKDRLRQRYARYLNLPAWSDTELVELSDRLQMRVIASLEIQTIVRRRLAA